MLIYEDCVWDIELALRTLRSSGFDVKSDVVVTAEEVVNRALTGSFDIILSDFRMPDATGMDAFLALRSAGITTPFILLTGAVGEEIAVECLKQGVADYVLKDRISRLPIAIRRARERERNRLERARAEESLRISEASYRSLIRSAPCGVLRLSAMDGRLLDANVALASMLGYDTAADLVKASAAGGIGLSPDVLSQLTAGVGPGHCIDCEVQWKSIDGTELLFKLSGHLLRENSDVPSCLEMIAENITERRIARKRIEQLNRLNSVLIHSGQAIVRTRKDEALFEVICRIIVEEGGFQMAWMGMVEGETLVAVPLASYPRRTITFGAFTSPPVRGCRAAERSAGQSAKTGTSSATTWRRTHI